MMIWQHNNEDLFGHILELGSGLDTIIALVQLRECSDFSYALLQAPSLRPSDAL